jgi:hypothetical protein
MGKEQLKTSRRAWEEHKKAGDVFTESPREFPPDAPFEDELSLVLDVYATDEDGELLSFMSMIGLDPDLNETAIAQYFFYLSEQQLPWDGIERIRASLVVRAIGLYDWFYTDFFTARADLGDPQRWKTFLPKSFDRIRRPTPDLKGYRKGPVCFVMHLPNVFAEARMRARKYAEALEQIAAATAKAENVPESKREMRLLARQIDLLTRNAPELRKLVKEKLFPVLYPSEREQGDGIDRHHRRWALAHLRAKDLIGWLGIKTKRFGDPLWTKQPLMMGPGVAFPEKEMAPASSQFSDATDDFLRAPLEARVAACDTIRQAIALLPQTVIGQVFLDETLRLNLADTRGRAAAGPSVSTVPVQQAGLPLVLSLLSEYRTEKGMLSLTVKTAVTVYTNPWARYAGNEKALERMKEWLKQRSPSGRVAFADLDGSGNLQWKKEYVQKGRSERVSMDPTRAGARAASSAKAVLNATSMLEDALSLLSNLQAVRDRKADTVILLGVVDSGARCVQDFRGFLAFLKSAATGTVAEVPGLITPLSYLSSALAVRGRIMDLFDSHDSGETIGRAIQLSATCLGLIAAGATSGMALVVVPIALWGLDWIGRKAAAEFGEAAKYLRACEFGEHVSFLDGQGRARREVADRVARRQELPTVATKYDEKWQAGWSIKEQLLALEDNVMYDFNVERTRTWRLNRGRTRQESTVTAQFIIVPRYPQSLATRWRWEIVGLELAPYRLPFTGELAEPNPPLARKNYNCALASDDEVQNQNDLGRLYRDTAGRFVVDLFHATRPNPLSEIRYHVLAGAVVRLTVSPSVSGQERVIEKRLNVSLLCSYGL